MALLILLILIVYGTAASWMSMADPARVAARRDQFDQEVLARAKEALLAWSVSHVDLVPTAYVRPGELPCPDFDDNGFQDSSCLPGQMGRLPYRTLGIEVLRDSSGNELWYAVGAGFRSANMDPGGINSDRAGSLLLYDSSGASLTPTVSQRLAAIIVAPGGPIGTVQVGRRSSQVIHYAEAALGRDNRTTGGPFITGPVRDANGLVVLNDKIIGVTAAEVVGAAEEKALSTLRPAIEQYMTANGGKAPNPASPSSADCLATVTNVFSPVACPSDFNRCYGRVPENVLAPYLPTWFVANGWGRVMPYAVHRDQVQYVAAECSTNFTLNGISIKWLFFGPGAPQGSQVRPSATLLNYLEDPLNLDAWTPGAANRGAFEFAPPLVGNDHIRSRG